MHPKPDRSWKIPNSQGRKCQSTRALVKYCLNEALLRPSPSVTGNVVHLGFACLASFQDGHFRVFCSGYRPMERVEPLASVSLYLLGVPMKQFALEKSFYAVQVP